MTRWTLQPGVVIACRPVGVLYLEDEAGGDEKILAVPVTKISPYYKDVENYTDLPPIVVEQIEHFFTHYKDLEPEKWVRVGNLGRRRGGAPGRARIRSPRRMPRRFRPRRLAAPAAAAAGRSGAE